MDTLVEDPLFDKDEEINTGKMRISQLKKLCWLVETNQLNDSTLLNYMKNNFGSMIARNFLRLDAHIWLNMSAPSILQSQECPIKSMNQAKTYLIKLHHFASVGDVLPFGHLLANFITLSGPLSTFKKQGNSN